jgi:hypothetical protein
LRGVARACPASRRILADYIFFVTLHAVALIRSLMPKGACIPLLSSAAVTVGALTLGEAVLIADAFPMVDRHPDKPLSHNVA